MLLFHQPKSLWIISQRWSLVRPGHLPYTFGNYYSLCILHSLGFSSTDDFMWFANIIRYSRLSPTYRCTHFSLLHCTVSAALWLAVQLLAQLYTIGLCRIPVVPDSRCCISFLLCHSRTVCTNKLLRQRSTCTNLSGAEKISCLSQALPVLAASPVCSTSCHLDYLRISFSFLHLCDKFLFMHSQLHCVRVHFY